MQLGMTGWSHFSKVSVFVGQLPFKGPYKISQDLKRNPERHLLKLGPGVLKFCPMFKRLSIFFKIYFSK
jgi:hypothetical protein